MIVFFVQFMINMSFMALKDPRIMIQGVATEWVVTPFVIECQKRRYNYEQQYFISIWDIGFISPRII
jgi:hypothetical protein